MHSTRIVLVHWHGHCVNTALVIKLNKLKLTPTMIGGFASAGQPVLFRSVCPRQPFPEYRLFKDPSADTLFSTPADSVSLGCRNFPPSFDSRFLPTSIELL